MSPVTNAKRRRTVKLISLILATLFSSQVVFAENQIITELVGKTDDGKECTYTVMKMNDWEGQTIVFLNSDTGNFRVELAASAVPLQEGDMTGLYAQQIILQYVQGNLKSVVEEDDSGTTIVEITDVLADLTSPARAEATSKSNFGKVVESYTCTF